MVEFNIVVKQFEEKNLRVFRVHNDRPRSSPERFRDLFPAVKIKNVVYFPVGVNYDRPGFVHKGAMINIMVKDISIVKL